MTSVAERSRAMIGRLAEIDGQVADALSARSLSGLQAIYSRLHEAAEAADTHMAAGHDACACDVALTNLLIVVGFAINRLDGEGRWQDWMRDEGLDLLQNFFDLARDCAADAGRASHVSRVTARLFEAL